MPSRFTSSVSATLLLLAAATAPAVEELSIDDGRNQLTARLADDELHLVERGGLQPGTRNRPMRERAVRTGLARGREALTREAAGLLASGTAVRAGLVAYLNGRMGDPKARAIVSRRIHIRVGHPADISGIVATHRLRVVSPEPGDIRGAVVEPIDAGLFAPLDAASALRADERVAMANPLLELPMEQRYDPDDPMYDPPPYPGVPPNYRPDVFPDPPNPPGYQWYLADAFPAIRVRGAWDRFKGEGQVIAINDGGAEQTHEDLLQNVRSELGWDWFAGDPYPLPDTPGENHATSLAGLVAARGDNGIGMAGVAFLGNLAFNRIFGDTMSATAVSDDLLGRALSSGSITNSPSDQVAISLNAWGPANDGATLLQPGLLTINGLMQGVSSGRSGRGIVYVWAAGNGGNFSPDAAQDTAGFDGHLTRFAIPVASITDGSLGPVGRRASYSEPGPNLIISAPGGKNVRREQAPPDPGRGIVTTDRSDSVVSITPPVFSNAGYVDNDYTDLPPSADFNGDWVITTTRDNYLTLDPTAGRPIDIYEPTPPITIDSQPDNAWRPFENGAYVPEGYGLRGTSYAAALVSGTAALMTQARPALSWRDVRALMVHRGQDVQPPTIPAFVFPDYLHFLWDDWRANAAGLQYNNFYGFGAVDVGRFVYGGGGTAADTPVAAGLNEPGALRWPLYPPLTDVPLSLESTFPLPPIGATTDPTAIYDAPPPIHIIGPTLVFDGRALELDGITRVRSVPMLVPSIPPRFRVDSVEVTVRIRDVGPQTYGSPNNVIDEIGDTPGFSSSQYHWSLTSPNGTTAILGRQWPGQQVNSGGTWQHTFTSFFHMNELLDPADTDPWRINVIDETDSAVRPNSRNTPTALDIEVAQARVEYAKIVIYGHQTYGVPQISNLPSNGVASGEGDQLLQINGSDFARTQGGLSATQAYWDPNNFTGLNNAGASELPTAVVNTGRLNVTIPTSLLPTTAPGRAFVRVANPAIVVGRGGGADAYDQPNELYPTPRTDDPERRMKECPDGQIQSIRYSRRPTLSPISDIRLSNGGSFTVSTVAFDADVAAGLAQAPPAVGPETLAVSVLSRNQVFVPQGNIVLNTSPGGNGLGTYQWTITTNGSASAFALIEVSATDGVTTTTRTFRVIIPSKEDGSGCGGGMGLALLGVPLGFWLLRRRKRDEKN